MNQKLILLFIILSAAVNVTAQEEPKIDTLDIGGVTIIRDNSDTLIDDEKKPLLKKLNSKVRPRTIKTEWAILDLGISNYIDNSEYASADAIRPLGVRFRNPFCSR